MRNNLFSFARHARCRATYFEACREQFRAKVNELDDAAGQAQRGERIKHHPDDNKGDLASEVARRLR